MMKEDTIQSWGWGDVICFFKAPKFWGMMNAIKKPALADDIAPTPYDEKEEGGDRKGEKENEDRIRGPIQMPREVGGARRKKRTYKTDA